MKPSSKTIILGVFLFFLYFSLVNTIPYLNFNQIIIEEESLFRNPNIQKISIHTSVSVIVERNKWYGKIIENGIYQDIYLFDLIKFPKKYKDFNFLPLHLFFLIISSQTLILLGRKWKKDVKIQIEKEVQK